jgi:hypothetical protein
VRNRAERWIFAAGTPERLAALRIGLCAVLTWRLTRGVFVDLAGQPADLSRPRSFMNLFSSQPDRGLVLAAQIGGIAAGALATVGLFARATLPVAWAAGMLLNGMVTSNGKIMHNDVLLLLCLVPLLIAPTADAWSLDALRKGREGSASVRYGWPVRTALLVVVGAYFFTGFAKLATAGPAWATSSNMRWVLYLSSDSQASPNPFALFVADRAWLAHLVAAATMLLELSFPVILWRPRLRLAYALGAAGLHGGIWLAMRLDYFAMAATAVIILIDWPAITSRGRNARGGRPGSYPLSKYEPSSRAGSESPAGDG